MNSLFELYETPVVPPYNLSFIEVGTIFKINHLNEVYFKVTEIEVTEKETYYIIVQCTLFGGSVRAAFGGRFATWQIGDNFYNGSYSIVGAKLGGNEVKKAKLLPYQKKKLVKALQKIKALQSQPKKLC